MKETQTNVMIDRKILKEIKVLSAKEDVTMKKKIADILKAELKKNGVFIE